MIFGSTVSILEAIGLTVVKLESYKSVMAKQEFSEFIRAGVMMITDDIS